MSETTEPRFAVHASRHFSSFLGAQGGSMAVSTYQAGKLLLLGTRPDGRLSVFERSLPRCMGLHVSADTLHVTTISQIWRFRNLLADTPGAPPPPAYKDHDALYAPRRCWVTGDLDAHDLALLPDGRPVFVNTLFSCLATVDEDHSFVPLWRPKFISRLAAEDRCHLNGLAMDEAGAPRYVTLVGASDVADGWREHRASGGMVIDVASGEVVAQGLSMPHSPRLHQGRLWVLNSGAGELGVVDPADGRFESVAFLPGYARGLAFFGRYAVVGLSRPRHNQTFEGLALEEALKTRDAEPRCGLVVVDIETGRTLQWLRFEHTINELYDVALLPGVRQAEALGFQGDDLAGATEPEVA